MGIFLQGSPTNHEQAAGSTTLTISVPTGVLNGELLVCWTSIDTNGTVTAPGGWTQEVNVAGDTNERLGMWWRVASSEPGSYNWTIPSVKASIAMQRYSGVDLNKPIDCTSQTVSGTTSSVTVPALTTATDAYLIAGANGNAAVSLTWTQPAGFTIVFNSTGTGKGLSTCGGKVVAGPGSTGTFTYQWNQSALELNAFVTALRPAPYMPTVIEQQSLVRAYNW